MNRHLEFGVWCMVMLRLEKLCSVRSFWSGGSITDVVHMM